MSHVEGAEYSDGSIAPAQMHKIYILYICYFSLNFTA